jgi:hypothetical protein
MFVRRGGALDTVLRVKRFLPTLGGLFYRGSFAVGVRISEGVWVPQGVWIPKACLRAFA